MTSSARTNYPTKVPGIPKPPADASPAMRRYLENLAEAVEIRLGRRGDVRDRAITYRDLINDGVLYERLAGVSVSGEFTPVDPAKSSIVPTAPTGFSANGAYSTVNLFWDYPTYGTHSVTEIWRHTADQLADAELLGVSSGITYMDPTGGGATYYYWIRHVSNVNVIGPWNSASGTLAQTAPDVVNLLNTLTGAIRQSELYVDLNTEINKISVIENDINTVNTTVSGLTSTVTTLNTTVNGYSASIQSNTSSINGIEAKYTVKIDNNGHVSGFGLISTANNATPFSQFIVNVDEFAIADATTSAVPFIVSGGSVYMKSAMIQNASITAAKIGSVSADSITSGTLDVAGRITAGSISGSKLILDGTSIISNNGTVEIGSLGVTSAKIADAAVGTLKIQGEAVTIPGGVIGSHGASIVNSNSSWTTVATLTLNNGTNLPSAIFVQGFLNFIAGTTGTTQCQPELRIEDSSGGYQTGTSTYVGWSTGLSVVGKFAAQSGTQTFYLKARNAVNSASYTVSSNGLFAQGIRR